MLFRRRMLRHAHELMGQCASDTASSLPMHLPAISCELQPFQPRSPLLKYNPYASVPEVTTTSPFLPFFACLLNYLVLLAAHWQQIL